MLAKPSHDGCKPCSLMVMADPVSTSLPERLRLLRRERHIKQVEVAAAIGVSRPYLSGLEKGHDAPGRETLMALAAFYDVSLEWLATGLGDRKGAAAAMNEEEALMLYAFRALPEVEAKPLLQMLLSRVKPPSH